MHFFPIHDLVDVVVSDDASDALLSSIEFQMGWFRASSPKGCPLRLRVEPFESAASLDADTAFHRSWGASGRSAVMPSERVGFAWDGDTLTVFASHGSGIVMLGLQLLLVRLGASLVHAAALLGPDERVVLVPGPGGVGKTSLVGELVRRGNHRLLGDDLVILDRNRRVRSFPRQLVLKEAHRGDFAQAIARHGGSRPARPERFDWRSNRAIQRILGIAYRNAPFVGVVEGVLWRSGRLESTRDWFRGGRGDSKVLASVPPAAVFGAAAIATEGALGRVVFLERIPGASPRSQSLAADRLVRRCFAILHHELVDHMRTFWQLGSLEIFDLPEYFASAYGILRDGLAGSDATLLGVPERFGAAALADLVAADAKERE